MINNKGQTLVLFLLLLPIILIILVSVINYGMLSFEKQKLENNIKYAIEYGLSLKQNETVVENGILTNDEIKNKIEYLLKQNISYDKLEIDVNDYSVSIFLEKKNNELLNIISNNKFEFDYYGTIVNNQIVIKGR